MKRFGKMPSFGRRTPMYLAMKDGCIPAMGEPYTARQLMDHVSRRSACPDKGSVMLFDMPEMALFMSDGDCTGIIEVRSTGTAEHFIMEDATKAGRGVYALARILTPVRVVDMGQLIQSVEKMVCTTTLSTLSRDKDWEGLMNRIGVLSIPDFVEKPVKGYKGLNKYMTAICKFQYELGREYSIDGMLVTCFTGFHFCRRLDDVFSCSPNADRLFEVETCGRVYDHYDGKKSVASRIRLVRELRPDEINAILIKEGSRWRAG